MEHLISPVHTTALLVALCSAVLLSGYLALNLRLPRLGLWPSASGWRHHTAFGLFRLFCGATVVFALSEVWMNGWGHWIRYVIGVPIMVLSFGITLWGYRFLGLDNTYCESEGLVTGGMYAYSRNPQYVTSVLATVGLGIASGSWVTLALALILFVIYFLFVLNEERWLLQGYGRAFQDYMRSTPRFVDERSLVRVREAILE
ncbi:methyltransferase family protein [Ruegeria arenilitoris]|uniref:methyltransferase family protein n=1 Tax=Ruegeria arenilitoris TaxID=1173585 RepID=UPI001481147F|nr:PEMT/PEM2 methyltransferase family protein [Ruegeria arenilitoris]